MLKELNRWESRTANVGAPEQKVYVLPADSGECVGPLALPLALPLGIDKMTFHASNEASRTRVKPPTSQPASTPARQRALCARAARTTPLAAAGLLALRCNTHLYIRNE